MWSPTPQARETVSRLKNRQGGNSSKKNSSKPKLVQTRESRPIRNSSNPKLVQSETHPIQSRPIRNSSNPKSSNHNLVQLAENESFSPQQLIMGDFVVDPSLPLVSQRGNVLRELPDRFQKYARAKVSFGYQYVG